MVADSFFFFSERQKRGRRTVVGDEQCSVPINQSTAGRMSHGQVTDDGIAARARSRVSPWYSARHDDARLSLFFRSMFLSRRSKENF
jgi:hypothetical protein